jgi:hypothetical protein
MSRIEIKQIRGLTERLNETSGSLKITLIQNNHGFIPGNAISFYDQNWVLANSNDENKLGRIIVETIIDSSTFVGVLSGIIEIANWGLVPSTYYFVDGSGDGTLTPDTEGLTFSNPIIQAITTEIAHVLPWRPSIIFDPTQTQEGLTQEYTQEETPNTTDGNYSSTGITIDFKPINNSTVQVYLNGLAMLESYGNRNGQVYFSNDNGVTARNVDEIQSGDTLYWNSIITGFELDENDYISLVYHKNLLDEKNNIIV